jgi:sodium transport system permease protein
MLVGAVIATQLGAPVMAVAVISQLLMLVVPLATLRTSGRTLAAVGLKRTSGRYYAAAGLIGASAWYLNMRFVELLPLRGEDAQLLELIDRPSTAVVIVAVAIVPAICEEVLFRGVLLRGLATRFFAPFAIAIAAAVFSLYHLRVVQLVPTFMLGLVLGYLALRADSVLPGMVAHFINNACALVIARGDAPGVASVLGGYPIPALVGFSLAATLGVSLATRRQRGHG